MDYRVTFDRIGRNHNVPPLTVTTVDDGWQGDTIAEAVYQEARKHLGSTWYDVQVNMETGRVSIGAGRFGSGSVEPVPA